MNERKRLAHALAIEACSRRGELILMRLWSHWYGLWIGDKTTTAENMLTIQCEIQAKTNNDNVEYEKRQ